MNMALSLREQLLQQQKDKEAKKELERYENNKFEYQFPFEGGEKAFIKSPLKYQTSKDLNKTTLVVDMPKELPLQFDL